MGSIVREGWFHPLNLELGKAHPVRHIRRPRGSPQRPRQCPGGKRGNIEQNVDPGFGFELIDLGTQVFRAWTGVRVEIECTCQLLPAKSIGRDVGTRISAAAARSSATFSQVKRRKPECRT